MGGGKPFPRFSSLWAIATQSTHGTTAVPHPCAQSCELANGHNELL